VDGWFDRSPFVGFVPWIIYWIVADGRDSTWLYGGLCAVLSGVILGVSLGWGRLKTLDVVTIAFFTGVTIAAVVVGATDAGRSVRTVVCGSCRFGVHELSMGFMLCR
jgi:hypothetical protein